MPNITSAGVACNATPWRRDCKKILAKMGTFFISLVVSVAAREIVAGKSWRNLRGLVLISMLAVGNILFHLQARFVGTTEYGTRLGIAAAVMLLSVICGRIVPSFAHNWLEQASPGRPPVAFGRRHCCSGA